MLDIRAVGTGEYPMDESFELRPVVRMHIGQCSLHLGLAVKAHDGFGRRSVAIVGWQGLQGCYGLAQHIQGSANGHLNKRNPHASHASSR